MQATFEQHCVSRALRDSCANNESQHAETPTIHSRSTSADSTSIAGTEDAPLRSASYRSQATSSQLPAYDYPTQLIVKNTFIDTPIVRPLSLDEFLPDRRIQSCPVDTQPSMQNEAETVGSSQLLRIMTEGAATLTTAASHATMAASTAATAVRCWWHPTDSSVVPEASAMASSVSRPIVTTDKAAPQVLSLAEAIAEPELGSPEMPTIGSAGHWVGSCRPCAFFHKSGCQNGVQCTFCHLCDASEKKRRQKGKIAEMRQMRRMS